MTHARRTRVRWGNVGRAALAVPIVALVVAWPRLGGDPPALPDDRLVPVRGVATAGVGGEDAPPTVEPLGVADGVASTAAERARRESERETDVDAIARAKRSRGEAQRATAHVATDVARSRVRRAAQGRRRSGRGSHPAPRRAARRAPTAAAPAPPSAALTTPAAPAAPTAAPRPVAAPGPVTTASAPRPPSTPPEFGFEQ